jgi:hypothetical protein
MAESRSGSRGLRRGFPARHERARSSGCQAWADRVPVMDAPMMGLCSDGFPARKAASRAFVRGGVLADCSHPSNSLSFPSGLPWCAPWTVARRAPVPRMCAARRAPRGYGRHGDNRVDRNERDDWHDWRDGHDRRDWHDRYDRHDQHDRHDGHDGHDRHDRHDRRDGQGPRRAGGLEIPRVAAGFRRAQ